MEKKLAIAIALISYIKSKKRKYMYKYIPVRTKMMNDVWRIAAKMDILREKYA